MNEKTNEIITHIPNKYIVICIYSISKFGIIIDINVEFNASPKLTPIYEKAKKNALYFKINYI